MKAGREKPFVLKKIKKQVTAWPENSDLCYERAALSQNNGVKNFHTRFLANEAFSRVRSLIIGTKRACSFPVETLEN